MALFVASVAPLSPTPTSHRRDVHRSVANLSAVRSRGSR